MHTKLNSNFLKVYNILVLLAIAYVCFEAFAGDRYLFQSGAERWFKIIENPNSFKWVRYNYWNFDRAVEQLIIFLILKIKNDISFFFLSNIYGLLSLFIPVVSFIGYWIISRVLKLKFYLYWSIISFTALTFSVHAFPTSTLPYSIGFFSVLLPTVLHRKSDSDLTLILILIGYGLSATWNDRSFYMSLALAFAAYKNYLTYNKRNSSLFQSVLFFLCAFPGLIRYFKRLSSNQYLLNEIKNPSHFIIWYSGLILILTLIIIYICRNSDVDSKKKSLLMYIPILIPLSYLFYYFVVDRLVFGIAMYENRHFVALLVSITSIFWIFYGARLEMRFNSDIQFRFACWLLSLIVLTCSLLYDLESSKKWNSLKENIQLLIENKNGCIVLSKNELKGLDQLNLVWEWSALSVLIQKSYHPKSVIIPETLGQKAIGECQKLDFTKMPLSQLLDFVADLPEN